MARTNSVRRTEMKGRFFGKSKYKNCHYCGSALTIETATLDHIRPHSKGGDNQQANFVIACHSCNQARGVRPYEEFKTEMLPIKQARKDFVAVGSLG